MNELCDEQERSRIREYFKIVLNVDDLNTVDMNEMA